VIRFAFLDATTLLNAVAGFATVWFTALLSAFHCRHTTTRDLFFTPATAGLRRTGLGARFNALHFLGSRAFCWLTRHFSSGIRVVACLIPPGIVRVRDLPTLPTLLAFRFFLHAATTLHATTVGLYSTFLHLHIRGGVRAAFTTAPATFATFAVLPGHARCDGSPTLPARLIYGWAFLPHFRLRWLFPPPRLRIFWCCAGSGYVPLPPTRFYTIPLDQTFCRTFLPPALDHTYGLDLAADGCRSRTLDVPHATCACDGRLPHPIPRTVITTTATFTGPFNHTRHADGNPTTHQANGLVTHTLTHTCG